MNYTSVYNSMIQYSDNLFALVNNILRRYPDLLNFIRQDRFTIRDTGISYRKINSLDYSDLLKKGRKSVKEWRKFSLIDLFYLHIIKVARELNISNKRLSYLFTFFYHHKTRFRKVGYILSSEMALIGLLTKNVPICLLIFSDGETILTDDPALSFKMGSTDLKKRPYMFFYLFQSFGSQIDAVIKDKDFNKKFEFGSFCDDYSIIPISSQQREILKIINNNQFSKISISKKPDGKMIVEAEEIINGSNFSSAEMLNLLNSIGFGSIKFSFGNGKTVCIRKNNAYKLESSILNHENDKDKE